MPVASHITDNLKMLHRYNTGSVVPVSDGAVLFNGSSDYIDTNSTFQSTFRDSHSICMWVKPNDGQPASNEFFLGSKNSSTEDKFYLAHLTDGKLKYSHCANNDEDSITSSTIFTDGAQDWTHIVITALKDESASNGFKLYINGALHTQANSSDISNANWGAFTTDIELDLGAYNENNSHNGEFDGYMCNVGIFSEVLTPAEIKSIMWKSYAGLTDSEKTNLVSWWNLSANANDSHGSNNGTLS